MASEGTTTTTGNIITAPDPEPVILNCRACKKDLPPYYYLQCRICQAFYDIECLIITETAYDTMSQPVKEDWVCPECTSAKPKVGNIHSPLRNTSGLGFNVTYTSEDLISLDNNLLTTPGQATNFVNNNPRGGLKAFSKLHTDGMTQKNTFNVDNNIILSEIYSELINLKKQNEILLPLKDEVQFLKQTILNMSQQIFDLKNAVLQRDNQMAVDSSNVEQVQQQRETQANKRSFAAALRSKTDTTTQKKGSESRARANQTDYPQNNNNLQVIIPSTSYPIVSTPAAPPPPRRGRLMEDLREEVTDPPCGKLTVSQHSSSATYKERPEADAKNNQRGTRRREIVVGVGVTDGLLKSASRIKHMQAWSFAPETTEELVREHVDKLLKSDKDKIFVQKRHIKSDRHSSFIVGVPEPHYQLLMDPNAWPKGVRVSEWFLARPRDNKRGQSSNANTPSDSPTIQQTTPNKTSKKI